MNNKHYRPLNTIRPDTKKTIIAVDWSNTMYRAWFSSREQPWLAYLRFFDMLTACVHKVKQPGVPIELIFAGESRVKLKRKEFDPTYKANRKFNENLDFQAYRRGQADILEKLGWGLVSYPGEEADDIIASIVNTYCRPAACTDVVIFSGDRDMCQLLAWDRVLIWRHPGIFVTKKSFEEEFGISVSLYTLYKALVGDKSDNITGVPGWGPERAKKALNTGSLDIDLCECGPDAIKDFEHSLKLVTLNTSIPIKLRAFSYNLDLENVQKDIALSIKRLLEELKT